MEWDVEFTDDFNEWWVSLSEEEQGRVDAGVKALETWGPNLAYPNSSGVKGSRHGHMRELRVQAQGRPLRVLYAFDPKRNAILLVGGDKTGDNRWYEVHVPMADRLYDQHLEELRWEAEENG
jgi:hypothetical protein